MHCEGAGQGQRWDVGATANHRRGRRGQIGLAQGLRRCAELGGVPVERPGHFEVRDTAGLSGQPDGIGYNHGAGALEAGGFARPQSLQRGPLQFLRKELRRKGSAGRRDGRAIALCLDQYGLMGREATTTLNTKEQWVAAASVYGQLVARFGEPAVVAAAGRLKGVAKDDRGGPRGDPESKGALFWFTALLKDPKTQVPDVSHFLASSYDPRWIGKMVEVRGTVSRVELDTDGSPRYATIHFKESKNDRFTAFTPHSDILGQNSAGLVGKPIEIWGQVQDWREGAGVRFLISKQFKVLDAGAMANFRESNPDWMKMPISASNLVDSPKYLAWKKFPPGSKASYENDLLHEYKPGTNQY